MVSVRNRECFGSAGIYQYPVVSKFQPHLEPSCIRLKNGKAFPTMQSAVEGPIFKYDIRSIVKFD